jgi:hypothetical protein
VGLTLCGISVEVLLCIEAAMGPATSCRPTNTCCRWCIVLEGVDAVVAAVTKAVTMEGAMAKALTPRARSLAGEGLLWPTVTQLALLSLARFVAA